VPPPPPPPAEQGALAEHGGHSKRQRFRPLRYWEGERVLYGRRMSSKFAAIVDVQIVEPEPEPLHKPKQQRKPKTAPKQPSTKRPAPAESEADDSDKAAEAAPSSAAAERPAASTAAMLSLDLPEEGGIVSDVDSLDDDDEAALEAQDAKQRAASYRVAGKKKARKA